MSKGSFAALAVVAALAFPALAGGQVVERVRIAGPGVTSSFPKGASLQLTSPPAYGKGAAGTWSGPPYWASGNRTLGGKASIAWSVSFATSSAQVKKLALAAPSHGWPLEKKDRIAVPHMIGKRIVGTIAGFYAITRSPGLNDAAYEAALAFPVAPKSFSIVRFQLRAPATDSAGAAGTYFVNGLDLPSIWNRGQAFWSLAGVRLVGNLPPTQVALARVGHTLRGQVTDAFRNPVLGLPVALERRSGGGWQKLTSTRTHRDGSFTIRVGGRGAYRAVAVSRGKTVASPVVAL